MVFVASAQMFVSLGVWPLLPLEAAGDIAGQRHSIVFEPQQAPKVPPIATNIAVLPDKAEERNQERLEVERAQQGDRKALGEILRRYGPLLYRSVLLPRLGSQNLAEEALAITYAKIVEKIGLFVWQNVGIYPWLRVVAMRVALDTIRARKREVPFDIDDLAREVDKTEKNTPIDDPERLSEHDQEWAKQQLEDALEKINPRYAQAIRLRILEEKSREDAAACLGITAATFDVVLHRALAALKKALPNPNEEAP